ncbi:MAG: NAD-dependent epimerase/dehydratase [Candidatus Woesebacteria bacterium GW2011_GWC1_42_9]|nr:MAG: NAD-dependent epimerase/dehydratase [Candidatus Woesebacteria bacterium GW2011_GWC1_42_9]
MKVLITGVAGLLGSRLADHLIEKGICVVGIDNLSGGYIENVNENVEFHKVDICGLITPIFKKHKFDVVYHFAAYAAEGLSPFIRKFNYSNNLIATANIINQCINNKVVRLVFTSSMAVYGRGRVPFEETSIPSPIDPYGIAKYACEMDIRVAGEQHDMDWCIIRPHNVYGENQNIWDKYRNVLGIWMHQRIKGESLSVFGFGSQMRSFTYIGDILEPLFKAGISKDASKQIINLGGAFPISIKNVAQAVLDATSDFGVGSIEYKEARHEVELAYCTVLKSEKLLAYGNETILPVGLKKMWQWAKRQPERKVQKWDDYEINDKIYSYWK